MLRVSSQQTSILVPVYSEFEDIKKLHFKRYMKYVLKMFQGELKLLHALRLTGAWAVRVYVAFRPTVSAI